MKEWSGAERSGIERGKIQKGEGFHTDEIFLGGREGKIALCELRGVLFVGGD